MIILVAGGSGSGKTTLANQIPNATVVGMDDFYHPRDTWPKDVPYFCDHPKAINMEALYGSLTDLLLGKPTRTLGFSPVDGMHHEGKILVPNQHIVVEGLWALAFEPLRQAADLRVFVDCPTEVRINRRIERDVAKGRGFKESMEWSTGVEYMHNVHVEPTSDYADLVVNGQNGAYKHLVELLRG